jgi:hypothetical protein
LRRPRLCIRATHEERGFAGRLAVARAYAQKLNQVADRLEPETAGFVEELTPVNLMVTAVFRVLREDPTQIPEMEEFLNSIEELATASENGLGRAENLANSVAANAKWSKDLRKPTRRVVKALRQISDARSVFRDWKSQVRDLRGQ